LITALAGGGQTFALVWFNPVEKVKKADRRIWYQDETGSCGNAAACDHAARSDAE
jgi:hypothetical protein